MSSTHKDPVTDVLKRARNIAVVGLSSSPLRPSHGVAAYMQGQGYRIIPVNPRIADALGEKSYAKLSDVTAKIDNLYIVRRSDFVPEVMDEAIKIKGPLNLMQEGVTHEA